MPGKENTCKEKPLGLRGSPGNQTHSARRGYLFFDRRRFLPNGTVRMVFIAHVGGGNEVPLTVKNLHAAEIDFVRTCGLTPERASALRTELDRNKVVSVVTSINTAAAAKFRYA